MKDAFVGVLDLAGLNQAAQDGRLWKVYKAELLLCLNDAIRATLDLPTNDKRTASLNDLRHVHHVFYVADRIRSFAVKERTRVPADLLTSAELIFERGGAARQALSRAETRFAASARVNWHKLLRRLEITTPRAPAAARKLRALAGKDFHSSEVAVLVEQYLEKTLAELREFVEQVGYAFPQQRPLLMEKWHRALEQVRLPSGE